MSLLLSRQRQRKWSINGLRSVCNRQAIFKFKKQTRFEIFLKKLLPIFVNLKKYSFLSCCKGVNVIEILFKLRNRSLTLKINILKINTLK